MSKGKTKSVIMAGIAMVVLMVATCSISLAADDTAADQAAVAAEQAYSEAVSNEERAPALDSEKMEKASVEEAKAVEKGGKIPFTKDMGIVMAVLGLAILMFIFEWVRVDVVGWIMMVCLPILGVVTPKEAISGLSSNAVVSIIAVIIIGAGLDKTGCMNVLARNILKLAGKSESRIMTLISATVAFISSFMQNIGAAALFMPAAIRIGKQTGIPVSRILMPMGFCAIIGGTITLVGASPTILLNDLIDQSNQLGLLGVQVEPLGLFTQTPIGIALVTSAILYFIIFGKLILPKGGGQSDTKLIPASIADTYKEIASLFEMEVPADFTPRTLEELHIRTKYHVSIVGIYNPDTKDKNYAPTRDEKVQPGEIIVIVGNETNIRRCADDLGFRIKDDLEVFAEDFSPNNAGIVEGIVTPRSELIGKTLSEVRFRKETGVVPVVLCRDGICQFQEITKEVLKAGDALLLFGRWEKFHKLREKRTFAFTTEIAGEIMREEKARTAVIWLLVAISLVMGFEPITGLIFGEPMKLSLSVCLLTGALGMILTKVLTIDEAYQSVDWMTVFLLGGLIPLGLAFQKTGAAEWIATTIMHAIGSVPNIVFLLVVGLLTSFFTLVVSNVGATVLLVPLCMSMAVQAGSDPRITAMVVALAASNTFVLPTHQVNALIMRPGGYRTVDYAKAGAGMTILFLVVLIGMLYMFY
jgi:di/tricarboxylate transporter